MFVSKTKEELSAMKIEDQMVYVTELSAEVDKKEDEHKAEMDKKEDEHKAEMDKKEDEDKMSKKAMDDKDDKEHQAKMKSAMEEEDKDKRAEMYKKAMDEHDEKKSMTHKSETEDDNEKKALEAKVTYMSSIIKIPKIEYLRKAYSAAKIDESKLKTFEKTWTNMDLQQLDAAITDIKPFISETKEYESAVEEKSPFGITTAPFKSEFKASSEFEKIDKMSDAELFNGDYPYA